MSNTTYYQLWTSATEIPVPTRKWYDWFLSENCCQGCFTVIQHITSVDCYVEQIPKDTQYSFVIAGRVDILARSFLDSFSDLAKDDLYLGDVFNASGAQLTEFISVRGKHRMRIRGGPDSMYRRCGVCGSHVYTPVGSLYILRSSLSGASIYQAVDHVVNEDIYQRITAQKWNDKHIHLDPLPILEEPLDGLGDLPMGPLQS